MGPYALIEDRVEIGAGTRIGAHVVVHSLVKMGERNRVHPHAVLGGPPQDVSFDGRETWVEIGDDNVIRETVTIHRATTEEKSTHVGSGCFLMVNAHIGHDCWVGDGVIFANDVNLGGHVEVGDGANLAGGVQVHQFVRIGALTMVGGLSGVGQDLLPHTLAFEAPAIHYRLNRVGLKRAGLEGERYRTLEMAFRAIRAGDGLEGLGETPELQYWRRWLAAPSKRGLARFLKSST